MNTDQAFICATNGFARLDSDVSPRFVRMAGDMDHKDPHLDDYKARWEQFMAPISESAQTLGLTLGPPDVRRVITLMLDDIQPAVARLRGDTLTRRLAVQPMTQAGLSRELIPDLKLDLWFYESTYEGVATRIVNEHRDTAFQVIGESLVAQGAPGWHEGVQNVALSMEPDFHHRLDAWGARDREVSFSLLTLYMGQIDYVTHQRDVTQDQVDRDIDALSDAAWAGLRLTIEDYGLALQNIAAPSIGY